MPSGLRLNQVYRALPAGGTQRFVADAIDQFGRVVVTASTVTWRAVGSAGSVAPDGTFTADGRPTAVPVRGSVVARLTLAGGGELVASDY